MRNSLLLAVVDVNAAGQVSSWSFSTTGVSLSGSGNGADTNTGPDSGHRYVNFGGIASGNTDTAGFSILFDNTTGFGTSPGTASLGVYNEWGWNGAFSLPTYATIYDLSNVTVAVTPSGSSGGSSSSGGSGHAVPAPALAGLLGLGVLGLASRRKRA